MALLAKLRLGSANNVVTKGINEAYGLLSTGRGTGKSMLSAMAEKYKKDVEKGKATPGGMYNETKEDEGQVAGDSDQNNQGSQDNQYPIGPSRPADLNAKAKSSGSGSSSNDAKIISSIGRGWDDSGDVIKDTSKSLGSSKNYISNLGKVRDQYLKSIDNYKNKTNEAIAGNKTLIEQNQKRDLDSLAGDTRKSMDNTNVMLGVKGASGGSASKAAARAIAQSAGKSRAGVLTAYGDETSKQNQAAKNAIEEYNTKREQAYEWEKTARKQAEDEYKAQESALKRLKNKASGWKDSDIKALSDKNLNNFMGSINAIQVSAKNFRDNLANKMTEYGGLADELDQAEAYIDAPAELDTPTFNENIDLTDPNNAEDWYDPKKTGQRVIKGYDAVGNPIYEDALVTDAPAA